MTSKESLNLSSFVITTVLWDRIKFNEKVNAIQLHNFSLEHIEKGINLKTCIGTYVWLYYFRILIHVHGVEVEIEAHICIILTLLLFWDENSNESTVPLLFVFFACTDFVSRIYIISFVFCYMSKSINKQTSQ